MSDENFANQGSTRLGVGGPAALAIASLVIGGLSLSGFGLLNGSSTWRRSCRGNP